MKNEKTVLVCVTAQESSENLVKAGKAIAERYEAGLEVVSVLPMVDSENRINPQIVESLYRSAQNQGGEMAIYFSNDAALTVSAHIARTKPLSLVVGFPGERSNDFIATIRLLVPEVPISMVSADGQIYNMLPQEVTPVKK